MINPRRKHLGLMNLPDIKAIADVGRPPLPLPAHVPLVDRNGKPTVEYHQHLTAVYDWQLRLYAFLGGTV